MFYWSKFAVFGKQKGLKEKKKKKKKIQCQKVIIQSLKAKPFRSPKRYHLAEQTSAVIATHAQNDYSSSFLKSMTIIILCSPLQVRD